MTDVVGREVAVRVPARRMILGEGRQLYIVGILDREDPAGRVVAWRRDLIEADPDTYAQYRARFPEIAGLPVIGGFGDGTVDLERVIALRPDVVFLNVEERRAAEEGPLVETLAAVGIPVLFVDFRYRPMERTDPTIRLFGRIMGREARAEALIAWRAAQMRRVTDVIEARRPPRPRVFVERIGGYTEECCLTFGDGSIGRLVAMAGGDNIAADLLPGTFGRLNPEQVIVSSPEHVVVTSARWEAYVPGGSWIGVGPGADLAEARRKLQAFTRRPAYAGSEARKNGAFHALWHQFYNSPYQVVALQQLALWLHPGLFPDLDPDATFRAFHERFLPVPYEPGYFVSLEGAPAR